MILDWLLHSFLLSADHKVKLGHLTITFTATVIGAQQFVLTPPSSHKIVNIPAASMQAVRSYPSIATVFPGLDDGTASASQFSRPTNRSLVLQPTRPRGRQVIPSIEGYSKLVTSTLATIVAG
jgi:hypothetical protein